ncbi:hypothetical protein DERF_011902 [Dermatophagoides farinae]|uniref:Uncharacterized protein n=1 Tax=Dermatophagoides farinae TaxID=6954 RepID=A0A922KZH3_DERFA|nr:hypothetical protein DERF_011902 [Dermatophagoides farinae]
MAIDVIDTLDCDDIIIRKPARFGKRFLYNDNNDDDSNMIMFDNGKREMIQSHPCFRLVRRSLPSSSPSSSALTTKMIDDNKFVDHDDNDDQQNNNGYYVNEYEMGVPSPINQMNNDDDKQQPIIIYKQQHLLTQAMQIKLPKKLRLIMKIYSILYGGGGGHHNHHHIDDDDDNNNSNDGQDDK